MRSQRAAGVLTAVFVVVLAGASAAWACSAQPRVFSVAPQAAASGDTVLVSGDGAPAATPVDVYWNSLEGKSMGRTTSDAEGTFAISVTVPEVPAGIYSIAFMASPGVGERSAGNAAGVGRMSFQVVADEPASVASAAGSRTDLWSRDSGSEGSASSSQGLPLALGVSLFSIGLVALLGGFTLATTRRRRVTAESEAGRS